MSKFIYVVKFLSLTFGRVLQYGGVLFAAVLFVLNIVYSPFIVLTGSMEPTIKPGDIVYIDKVDDSTIINTNDIVLFQPESGVEKFITHRVTAVEYDQEGNLYKLVTKGDNNNVVDEPIYFEQVVGVVDFHIPKLGLFVDFVKTNPIAGVGIALSYILVTSVLSSLGSFKKIDE